MKALKEKYLLFKAKSFNDADAFGQIYDLYIERIYRFIFFKVGNKQDAEDIASETFLRAWEYIKEGREIRTLQSFLYQVARNLVIDHYRFNARKKGFEEGLNENIISSENLFSKLEIKNEKEKILDALKLLKDEYCEVVVLRYLEGMSTSETAQIIGKSQNNTRVLTHRALRALKEALASKASNI